jgi:hypothetical protein
MENIVDLETKTIELLNSIQAIKYSKKIIHHDLKFSDIENLNHVLIALVKTTLNQTEDEKKNRVIIDDAIKSLWKIREYLLLEDDVDPRIQRLKEIE